MVESYLHKMAKELLYKEIEEKSGFEYKLSNGDVCFKPLISREDYCGEYVLMEFPTKGGYYPDEFGCTWNGTVFSCETCFWKDDTWCNNNHNYNNCTRYLNNEKFPCRNTTEKGFRFKTATNTCKCLDCEFFDFSGCVVHDIAAFWKGNVRWAIEIINKHEPNWTKIYASMPYNIYFIKAEDILKRIDSTPVFVYKIIRTCYPE